MNKYIRIVKLWILDRVYSGTAWDHFLLGLIGLVVLVLLSLIIGYV